MARPTTPGTFSLVTSRGRPSPSVPILALYEFGPDDAGNGQREADADGVAVSDGLGLVRSPNGLLRSDDGLAAGEAVAVGCNATLGAFRADHTAKAVTEPATRVTATTAVITTSRREGILTK